MSQGLRMRVGESSTICGACGSRCRARRRVKLTARGELLAEVLLMGVGVFIYWRVMWVLFG